MFPSFPVNAALLRTALLVGFAAAIAVPAWAQQTVQERDDVRVRKIRRVTEWRHPYRDGKVDPKGTLWGYLEYDRRGNLVVTGRFVTDSVVSPMYVREYDAADKPVKRTWFCDRTAEQPSGRPCLVFRGYRLDEYGNVAEENGYDLDGSFVARVSFQRDAAGRPLERWDYFGEGSSENRHYRYHYNDRGDAIETRTFDADGKIIKVRRTDYRYDAQGRMVEWNTTDSDGVAIGSGRDHHDENGNRTESVDLDPAGQPVRRRRFVYEFWD